MRRVQEESAVVFSKILVNKNKLMWRSWSTVNGCSKHDKGCDIIVYVRCIDSTKWIHIRTVPAVHLPASLISSGEAFILTVLTWRTLKNKVKSSTSVVQWYSTYWQEKRSDDTILAALCSQSTQATEASKHEWMAKRVFLVEDIVIFFKILTSIFIWKYFRSNIASKQIFSNYVNQE
jgi:hypothetical protein